MKNKILQWQLKRLAHEFSQIHEPPFIIIGMHRSGTSAVTRILRAAGGHFGYYIDPNSEAFVFLRFNHNFLGYSACSWDVIPEDFNSHSLTEKTRAVLCLLSNRHLLWSDFFQNIGKESIEITPKMVEWRLLTLTRNVLDSYKKYKISGNTVPFWGWKDPRTTLTLPLWLRLFPNARVIHVIRNGIDASLSLWRRSKISREGAPHCLELNYCFRLWEKYVNEGIKWQTILGDRYIEIYYEDLLNDTLPCLNKLLSFVAVSSSNAESLSKLVKKGHVRTQTTEEERDLNKYASHSHVFRHLGYDKAL